MSQILTAQKQKLFINGKWKETTEYKPLQSPYDLSVIAEIPVSTSEDLEEAIASAHEAKTYFAKLPAHKRAEILENLVNLLLENSEKAARIIALEAAKPIRTAREEVKRTIQTYKFAAQEAGKMTGETIALDAAPGGENRLGFTISEPLGVIGAITPFNFPMNLVAHKLGPAIATGNTIVLKPASQTPLSSFFIAELLQKAGLPDGALNVVTGSGSIIGDRIVQDSRINMITFTGSPSVGRSIKSKAGLKKTTLELGSNAAVIIDQDQKENIQEIAKRAVQGAFSNQGQVCISLQRAYVHKAIYKEFVQAICDETASLKIGHPLEEDTDISALISKKDADRVMKWIEEAKNQGAELKLGGKQIENMITPTILTNVSPSSKVSCEEVFGPVLLINKISSIEEGLTNVNDSKFGLQAGIYTQNVENMLKAIHELKVGGVIVNDIPTFRVDNMPYGGVKESGVGKEGIKYAIEEMVEHKLVVIKHK